MCEQTIQTCVPGLDGLPGYKRFGHGLDIIQNGIYQVCNTQTMQTIVNQMPRFAHGLDLV